MLPDHNQVTGNVVGCLSILDEELDMVPVWIYIYLYHIQDMDR